MAMLNELHNQNQDKFYACKSCKRQIKTRYHCQECGGLCTTCYNRDGHPHKMIRLGLGLEDGSTSTENKNRKLAQRFQFLQRCIQSTMHAAKCRDANCSLHGCFKIKRVLSHAKTCKKKNSGGCYTCKMFFAPWYFHARYCKAQKCVMPNCNNLKRVLKRGSYQRFQQLQLVERRMQQMNARMMDAQQSLSTTMVSQLVQSAIQNMQAGMKPPQGPPPEVLEAVKEIQQQAQQQAGSTTAVSYGKGNLGNLPINIQPQMSPSHIGNHQVHPLVSANPVGPMSNMVPQMSPIGKSSAMMQQPPQQQPQPNRTLPGMEQLWNCFRPAIMNQQKLVDQQGQGGQQGQMPQQNATQALQYRLQALEI